MRTGCCCLLIALLLSAGSRAECPVFKGEPPCDSADYCDWPQPSNDELKCANEYLTMQARETLQSTLWEDIKEVTCLGDVTIATRAKGNTKNFDYAQFRCRAPACAVDTAAAKASADCPEGDKCYEATLSTANKSSVSCPDPANQDLEALKKDGRWVEVSDNRCFGSTITSENFKIATNSKEKMEVYQCRVKRKCDVTRFNDYKCGLKETCENIDSTSRDCKRKYTLQASFTKKISWLNVSKNDKIICSEDERMTVENILDIPMVFRCVKEAGCDIKTPSPRYDGTCDKPDSCEEPEPEDNVIKCPRSSKYLETRESNQPDGPWKFLAPVNCYNKLVVDEQNNDIIIDGIIRCRSNRGNSMKLYFDKTLCEQTKKCAMPLKLDKSEIKYSCSNIDTFDTWKFEGKLTTTGLWIPIESAEFRKDVFVMIKQGGSVDPYIPIQFRCIREATCEVDLNKFDNWKCPNNDDCKMPEYNQKPEKDKEKYIVCLDDYAIEFQSDSNTPWRELNKIKCYNKIMEPKKRSNNELVTVKGNTTKFRCRKLRECKLDKYYNKDNKEICDNRVICKQPELAAEMSCPIDSSVTNPLQYELQYKALEKWEKIAKVVCEEKRFILKNSQEEELEDIPIQLRCVFDKKCNIDHFYVENYCEETQICAKPSLSNNKLKCTDPVMALRVKFTDKSAWEVATSIKCEDDAFKVEIKKGYEYPLHIQCVKLRSTLCAHPCGSADSCPKIDLTAPTTPAGWDQPVTLWCTGHTETTKKMLIFGTYDQGNVFKHKLECTDANVEGDTNYKWKITSADDEKVECLSTTCWNGLAPDCIGRALCTQKSPITDYCDANDQLCSGFGGNIQNINEYSCKGSTLAFVNRKTKKVITGTMFKCTDKDGYWEFYDGAAGHILNITEDDNANLICQWTNCSKTWLDDLFPVQHNCTEDLGQHCERPVLVKSTSIDRSPSKMSAEPTLMGMSIVLWQCPEDYLTYYRTSDTGRWNTKKSRSGKFGCCKGVVGEIPKMKGMPDDSFSCTSRTFTFEPTSKGTQVKCARNLICQELYQLRSDCEGRAKCKEFKFIYDKYETYKCNTDKNWWFHVDGERVSFDKFKLDDIACDHLYDGSMGFLGSNGHEMKLEPRQNVVCIKINAGASFFSLAAVLLWTALGLLNLQ